MSYIYPIETKKSIQYKVYYPYHKKKLYIGSYKTNDLAIEASNEATAIMNSTSLEYTYHVIPFKKWITLCNYRDHFVYLKNPIYLYDHFFKYFLDRDTVLYFDMKDLLFFSSYKIYKRGNYLYTSDGITQQNILQRFGILNHSVYGKDYYFKNNNRYDFRRENIEIVKNYKGVHVETKQDKSVYVAKIYIHSNLVIGYYDTELEAAIAYNKAVDYLIKSGSNKKYIKNEFPFLTMSEYKQFYNQLSISSFLLRPSRHRRITSSKKYRGVYKDKSGFKASMGYKNTSLYLGIYPTAKRAAQAYNFASFYLYGNNGYINDVSPLVHDSDAHSIAAHLKRQNVLKQ